MKIEDRGAQMTES